jgi:aromatic ring-opening dioxygenase catalytic subunit (LigB family)
VAKIVASMALSHAPGLSGWLESVTAEQQADIAAGFTELRRRFEATKPDLIIGVANDHMLNMPMKNPPDFCIGTAQQWTGPAEFFRDWLKMGEYRVAGRPDVAAAIERRALADGVTMMHADTLLFDDNWSVPLHYLTPAHNVPLVPINMNCINPPIPGPERSYRAGQAIVRAIREDLPDDLRVAFIGTGGLSHEPGGERYFDVDETFDRWFLDLLGTGDVERILAEATVERMEAAGGGGTAELMAWLVAMAGARDTRADTVFYVPAVEMRCGIGAVTWDFSE